LDYNQIYWRISRSKTIFRVGAKYYHQKFYYWWFRY